MRRGVTVRLIWCLAFLMAGLVAACGREQAPDLEFPVVVSAMPANGAMSVPTTLLISATFNEVMNATTVNTSTFVLTGPAGAPVTGAVAYSGTTATFMPAAPLAADTLYAATVTTGARDPTGNGLASNFVWTFTTALSPAPVVVSTVPVNGATAVSVNTAISATFSEAMNAATINATSFTLTGPGATPVAGAVSYAGSTATFTPTAVLAASTLYTATITTGAKAPTGIALAANFVWTFTTAPPPTVASTVPVNGATAVPVNTAISVTFSEAMNATTINAATFTLTGPGATPVAGAVTYAGTTATFMPAAPLAADTLYTATVTTGARDPTGNRLTSNFVWTFTTALSPAPVVVSTVPVNGATAVSVNTAISATFSEAMNPVTISASTVTLTGPGTTPIAGTVTYADATATFTPTAVLATNTLYAATITTGAKDPAGVGLAANYMWTFTTAPPAIVLTTTPANGAVAVPANTPVCATFSEAMNPTTINATTFTLTGPGATPVAGAVTYAGTTATFTPTTALAGSALFTATITTGAQDTAGHSLAANFVWTFTTAPPPTVISTVPVNGASAVSVNTAISATFSEAMNAATINATSFTLTGPGATPVAGAVSYAGSTATFTPTVVLAAGTLYTATITTGAKDPTGVALAANFVWTFTAAPPPTVVSTAPAEGATGVAKSTNVTATFSVPMDAATVNATTFTLTGPGATAVSGSVAYAGDTATFTPTAPLAASTLYTATITTGAQDPTGNALAANYVWTFATAAGPAVTSTNPASAATDVPINQKITATFSEPIAASTITAAGTFAVAVAGGGSAVAGTVAYDAASNTAIFTPSAALAANVQFTATVTTAAQDPSGNALGSDYVWSFTTGPEATSTGPMATSTNPADGAIAVPLNQAIAAIFTEAMDPATISAPGTFTVVETIGGAAVMGSVTYDTASNSAIFTPSANLTAATQYTATLSTAAQSLAGNALITGGAPSPYQWSFTTGSVADTAAPTMTAANPADAASNVPINMVINATFGVAMDPLTIRNATFTLAVAGVGGAPVDGTVEYDPASQIATFTPAVNLTAGTEYTATISNLVTDLSGNALAAGAAPNPWSFTAGASVGPIGLDLGAASTFGAFGDSSGLTNSGITTMINGDIGTTDTSAAVTGFHDPGLGCTYTETGSNVGFVNGTIDTAPPPNGVCASEGTAATFAIATQVADDALAAYNNLLPASRPGGTDPNSGQLGGLVLPPGIYKATNGSFSLAGSDLTLDGQGDANAIWVFQMSTSLTVGTSGAPASVILINGAQAKNVFWQVGSQATINPSGGGVMAGTIIAAAGITFSTAGNIAITALDGRALALGAPVTMVDTVINVPAP